MYRLFIQYLQPDGEVTRLIYDIEGSAVLGIMKALNKEKFVMVQVASPEGKGIVVPIPTDRIILAELIPIALIELQQLRQQEAQKGLADFIAANPVVPPPRPEDVAQTNATSVSEG